MASTLIALACALAGFLAARRSLTLGLAAVLTVGYLYGITRANIQGTGTYLMFDLSVLGLYAAQLFALSSRDERVRVSEVRLWMIALIVWPSLLFVTFLLSPTVEPLVELVGLRGNVFLLPFLLFGGRLSRRDLEQLAIYCAALNLGAAALGGVEFVLGIERFYPLNETTEIIYRSRDLAGFTAHRIPASFVNAHAFAGTMACTLPLLLGAWAQPHERRWQGVMLGLASVSSFIGVFLAAARTHMITAAVLAVIFTLAGGLSRVQRLRWLAALVIVGYVVAGDARLQRFTTLTQEGMLSQRIGGSLNENMLDVLVSHPLGNGLTSGGTSVPYFLLKPGMRGMLVESEYARIALEQGMPGLILWSLFIAWALLRRPGRFGDAWRLGRRLAWAACLSMFVSGALGIGMMASVPQTAVMLLLIGWFTTAPRPEEDAADAMVEGSTDDVPLSVGLLPVHPPHSRRTRPQAGDLGLIVPKRGT